DQAFCFVARDVLRQPRHPGRCHLDALIGASPADPPDSVSARLRRRLSQTPIVAITHSLGSFLVFDGQMRSMKASLTETLNWFLTQRLPKEIPAYGLLDNGTVFMFANQVALLQLARTPVECTHYPCPIRFMPDYRPGSQSTTYVAFNDI